MTAQLLGDCDTPVGALLRLDTGGDAFLLESVEGGDRVGRYSFLGVSPLRTLEVRDRVATVRERDGGVRTEPCDDPLRLLERETVRDCAPAPVAGLPFSGGAVGYLGYEAAGYFERVQVAADDPLRLPDAWFGVYDTVVVVDRVRHRMVLVTHAAGGADPRGAHAAAVERLEALRDSLRRPLPPAFEPEVDGIAAPAPAEETASLGRDAFTAAVARCHEHILAGDVYQVQISRRFSAPLPGGEVALYRALRALNPSPYMFFLRTPAAALVGASPETLVRVRDREVLYRPIAGTRRRGRDAATDAAMEAELRASEKEQAEHLMLVDLGRNDVGRVCEAGSVRVTERAAVERYSHVMHLVSTITGRLRGDRSAVDALRACFPAGTVTGAPKLRAMEIIAAEEPQRRGAYAGAVGYLDLSGTRLDTAIALRTAIVQGGVAHLQAAAGIVADSSAVEELLEIDNKTAALRAAVAAASAR